MAPRSCGFRVAAVYHNLLALASIVLGIVLLVHAIRDMKRFSTDEYSQGEQRAARNFEFLDVAEGTVLIVFGLASLLAARKRCIGVTFRVIFLVSSFVVVAWLIFLVVAAVRGLASHEVSSLLSETYQGTHNSTESEMRNCAVETTQKCRGLDDGDCKGCVAGSFNTTCTTFAHCADCSLFPQYANVSLAGITTGCRTMLVGMEHSILVRKILIRGFLILAVMVDIFLSCRFPIHVTELMVDEAPEEMEVTE